MTDHTNSTMEPTAPGSPEQGDEVLALFERVAAHVVSVVPDAWRRAWLKLDFEVGRVTIDSRVVTSNAEGQPEEVDLPIDVVVLAPLFLELQTIWPGGPFVSARFELDPEGEFDFQVIPRADQR